MSRPQQMYEVHLSSIEKAGAFYFPLGGYRWTVTASKLKTRCES
jgi:hypothetical protein